MCVLWQGPGQQDHRLPTESRGGCLHQEEDSGHAHQLHVLLPLSQLGPAGMYEHIVSTLIAGARNYEIIMNYFIFFVLKLRNSACKVLGDIWRFRFLYTK